MSLISQPEHKSVWTSSVIYLDHSLISIVILKKVVKYLWDLLFFFLLSFGDISIQTGNKSQILFLDRQVFFFGFFLAGQFLTITVLIWYNNKKVWKFYFSDT